MKPTDSDLAALRDVAQSLGVLPDWLAAVINFETAGTWDPQIKNPLSSARGLIQFTDLAAKGIGFDSALDLVTKYPTIAAQLKGPVHTYLRQFAPFDGEQDFVFSVFLPKYRKAPLDTIIYGDEPDRMARFQKANPGIVSVGDYFGKLQKAFVRSNINIPPFAALALGLSAAAGIAGLIGFLRRLV